MLLPVAAIAALTASSLAAEGWLTDFQKAAALSKKTGRPILADFTGSDWCGWCIRLHKEVFSKPEFKKWASANVVLLELDYPQQKPQAPALKKQNQALVKKYKIEGFPTVLFLKHDGTVLGNSGYMDGGPAPWIKHANGVIKKK